jgi:formate hydrogenlyase subunit 3/multisubunit Na+/H+ antiporter MnhD subunit
MTISMPLLWVVLPIVIAAIGGIFNRRKVFAILFSGLTTLGLALLAAFFPEDLSLRLGPINLVFVESLAILGRQIRLSYAILPFISFTCLMTSLWIFSSGIPGAPLAFRPSSLVIIALLTAALGVEPFLYAAVLIQIAILVSLPMLSPIEVKTHPGILRYLSLQTLAMPFILLAGWLLSGVESIPTDSPLVGQSMMLLGLGFAIWVSVFPFHSWVPMVSQHSQSTAVSYLLFILPTTIFVFGLNFFQRYAFLRTSENIYEILRIFGALMVVFGGFMTAYQTNLKRAFGFTILSETGFSLLAVGIGTQSGLELMLAQLPSRALALLLWGFALARIEYRNDSLETKDLQGFARHQPILSLGVLLSQLSIAGLPLFAGFPIKLNLLKAAFDVNINLGAWSFIGNIGLILFTLRALNAMVLPKDGAPPQNWEMKEKAYEYLPILALILVLIILGLYPNAFLSGIIQTLGAFPQLQ